MARRRRAKDVIDIEQQAERIERAGGSRGARAREIANRYIDNIYNTRSMRTAVDATRRYGVRPDQNGNTWDYEVMQMNTPYPRSVYTGQRRERSTDRTMRATGVTAAQERIDEEQRRVTRSGNRRNRAGFSRGITISAESLEAFRRRRDAAKGSVAG